VKNPHGNGPFTPISELSSVSWPAILSGEGAQLLAVLQQLEQSQWWSAEELRSFQFQQLSLLLQHACKTVPFYKSKRYQISNTHKPLTYDAWQTLPLLTRNEIQQHEFELISNDTPKQHGKIGVSNTSGSAGQPITVHKTLLNQFFWNAFTLREHFWHKRDFSGKLAVIRTGRTGQGVGEKLGGNTHPNWGAPVANLYETGTAATLDISTPIRFQAEWLIHHNPEYLLSYPSNIAALAEYFLQHGKSLSNLRQIRTISEMIKPGLYKLCEKAFGINDIVDTYSSREIGYIAFQCPKGSYHIQSENALVEVINEKGEPCSPGEIGRVVVTDLHNFSMPLLRYEILDYAEVGEPCSCKRGLPTLRRIVGRQRNMLKLPNGDRQWVNFAVEKYRDIAPVKQAQLVQKTLDKLELRLVVERKLTETEEVNLAKLICTSIAHKFDISFDYRSDILRSKNGKFEEFYTEIGD